jgi:hypothetical protein
MVVEKLCPVCGFEMEEGPRDYNICPSCGTEFGLHDVNSSIENLQKLWIDGGLHWYSRVIPQPPNWNPEAQLQTIVLNAPIRARVSYVLLDAPAFSGNFGIRYTVTGSLRRKRHTRLMQPPEINEIWPPEYEVA